MYHLKAGDLLLGKLHVSVRPDDVSPGHHVWVELLQSPLELESGLTVAAIHADNRAVGAVQLYHVPATRLNLIIYRYYYYNMLLYFNYNYVLHYTL